MLFRSIDLKYGANPRNAVEAEDNPQLMIYALAALEQFSMAGEFDTVRLIIHQPRLNHKPEHVMSVLRLLSFGAQVHEAARVKLMYVTNPKHWAFNPAKKTCQWCAKKATCPALASFVTDAIGDDFEAIIATAPTGGLGTEYPDDVLAEKMQALDLIEMWSRSVRAEVERRLLNNIDVPGYKLVQGKRGNRAWLDAGEVEKALKSMRLKQDEMYTFNLITPTAAEKLLKPTPKRWGKIVALIGQSEGKPSVAPASDPRPALAGAVQVNDFNVTDGSDMS